MTGKKRNGHQWHRGHIVFPPSGQYHLLVLFVAGIQSDDAGTLRCLKRGTDDSLAELKLTVQGFPYF